MEQLHTDIKQLTDTSVRGDDQVQEKEEKNLIDELFFIEKEKEFN
jgi:hypothetical protein